MYLSAEYRWEAVASIELVGFYDTGKVFPHRSGFSFDKLKHTWGGGIRVKTMRRVFLRMELGKSPEGLLFFFSMGPAW